MAWFFGGVSLVAMNSAKSNSEQAVDSTATAAQIHPAPKEYADMIKHASEKPNLELSQEEFDTFSCMVCATDAICQLLHVFKENQSTDPEYLIRLSFLDHALMKNRARVSIFIKNHAIPVKDVVSSVKKFRCGSKRLDKHTLTMFSKFWHGAMIVDASARKGNSLGIYLSILCLRKDCGDYERDKVIDAICVNDIQRLKGLLKPQDDLNKSDILGHYPLMYAVIFNDPCIARELIGNGASLYIMDVKGAILPMFMNQGLKKTADDLVAMKKLVGEVGPNFFHKLDGLTPLMQAVTQNSEQIACALITRRADATAIAKDGKTTAYSLASTLAMRKLLGDRALVSELKHRKALKAENQKQIANNTSEVALVIVPPPLAQPSADDQAIINDPDLQLRIKAFKAVPHEQIIIENDIDAAYRIQLESWNDEHAKALLRVFSFFQERNIERNKMFHILHKNNHLLAILLQQDYDRLLTLSAFSCLPAQKNVDRLIDAIRANDACQAQALVKQNPGVINESDRYGYTPLFYAVFRDNSALTQLLIALKADVNGKNGLGLIPLIFAQGDQMKNLLFVSGARADFLDNNHQTPLQTAVNSKYLLAEQAIRELMHERTVHAAANASTVHGTGSSGSAGSMIQENGIKQATLKKQEARERAQEEKLAAQKKKYDDKRARKLRRETIESYRNMVADKADSFWRAIGNGITKIQGYCQKLRQQEMDLQAQEQALMHKEDRKLLLLFRIVTKQQSKQNMRAPWSMWRRHVKHENERLAVFKAQEKAERLRLGCSKLAVCLNHRLRREQKIVWEKMQLFAWIKIMEQKIMQEQEAQQKIRAHEGAVCAAQENYWHTGIKNSLYIQEERRLEQLQRRRSQRLMMQELAAQGLAASNQSKKLNAQALEFVPKK